MFQDGSADDLMLGIWLWLWNVSVAERRVFLYAADFAGVMPLVKVGQFGQEVRTCGKRSV